MPNRLSSLPSKIRRAWADGTMGEKVWRVWVSRVWTPAESVAAYIRLGRTDRRMALRGGFADHRQEPSHCRAREEDLRRIIAAYHAAKRAQERAPAEYAIRGLWAEWIDRNYQALLRALRQEDVAALGALFENLQREQFATGTGGSGFDQLQRYRTLTGNLYVRSVWSAFRDKYRALGEPIEKVHYPWVGNPVGILLNGDVIQTHAFRHAYHAVEMREWLRDVPRAVVVEIGGGIGGQAFQAVRLGDGSISKYVIFDIPEVASIASYFLLSAFPDKRVRLFGEGPVSVDASQDYDLAVFPHFEIAGLPDDSVDLYHNACSFSEMDGVCAAAYLRVIERTCRRYFSHINHEVRFYYRNPDGSPSTNLIGSQVVPDRSRFKRVYKKPRVFFLPEDRPYEAYEYLYERIRGR